jgi:hypothetical protein
MNAHLLGTGTRALVILAVLVIGLFLGSAVRVGIAQASTTSNLSWLSIAEDHFYNYDFNSQLPLSNNVDWPITMLYWNNAEVDKVKNAVGYLFDGNPQYLVIDDSGGTGVWDQDSGTKNIFCPSIQAEAKHMRVYADGDDRLYNIHWGYYVLASTHGRLRALDTNRLSSCLVLRRRRGGSK